MSEAVQTLDGWYGLHDFRKIDWASFKLLPSDERKAAIHEFLTLIEKWNLVEEQAQGSHVFYTIVGQKADFMFKVLRPTMEELQQLQTEFNKTTFAEYTIPTYSYISVTELSNYIQGNEDPMDNPYVKSRLFPTLPKSKYLCFYPMNKKREGNDNWYMLSMEERQSLMKSHGLIGRSYAGKVKQFIGGSVGFDDYEWGVTLFSDDVLQFKKLVYEMRFDEVSARYGEFGPFYIGTLLTSEQVPEFLQV